jgi:hypothetical protein
MKPLTIQEIKNLTTGTLVIVEQDFGNSKNLRRGIITIAANDLRDNFIRINNEISFRGVHSSTLLYIDDAIDETTIRPPGSHKFRLFLGEERSDQGYSYPG